MKTFSHSSEDQLRLLSKVAANSKMKGHATVATEMPFLTEAYRDYVDSNGNPWLVARHEKDDQFAATMGALFKSRAADLKEQQCW